MKVLCICQGGNVRSVALATELKQRHRVDALAAGYVKNRPETLRLLMEWADRIVVMRDIYRGHVPAEFSSKVTVAEVGEDTYGSPTHRDLKRQVREAARLLVGDGR